MSVAASARTLRTTLAVALIGIGLVAAAPGPAVAAPEPCRQTFAIAPGERPIPDQGSVASTIDVPDDGLVVADVDVSATVHHARVDDLAVDVISHTDTGIFRAGVRLFDHSGQGTANLFGTVFDDEARMPTTWGAGPFADRFIPTQPLHRFDDKTGGRFDLVVTDSAANVAGTLVNWSVTLTFRSCDFDGDGVEDHVDSCRGVTARTATGCPLTSRKLTATYRHGKFRGALSSPVTGCKAGRPVSVFRVRRGADVRVGSTTSRADGSWRLARAKKPGRYYATSARVVVPNLAECPAASSRTFQIR